MAKLSVRDRKKLASILGMLGSNAPGERDNAARLAEQFRRELGLTWADLLELDSIEEAPHEKPAPPRPSSPAAPTPSRSQPWRLTAWLKKQTGPDRIVQNLYFLAAVTVVGLLIAYFGIDS